MKKKKKGLTLVELVVVMAIMAIFGGAVMTLFLSQNKSLTYVQDSTILQNEARLVLNSLEEDIRVAKDRKINATSISTVGGNTYTPTTGQIVIYAFNETLTGEVNPKTFAYICDTTKGEIKKYEVADTGSVATLKEIATLTKQANSKDASGVFNGIKIKEDSPAGATRNKVYEIELNLVKGQESLSFNSRVTTRN